MTRAEALQEGTAMLRDAGIESPRREARLLLAHALGLDQASLLLEPKTPTDPQPYRQLVARRCGREPLAYIVGSREFWSLSFQVSACTLIPRPESEVLIEAAVSCFPDRGGVESILDLGTGTGCLLLAALTEFPAAFGVGVDIEPAAARLAARNAVRLGKSEKCAFVAGRWADALLGCFDLVLSNPPYVRSQALRGLSPEIWAHEPVAALDGGSDGLESYRCVLPNLPRLLRPGGVAIFELGAGQAREAADLARGFAMTSYTVCDLAGIPRALVMRGSEP
jgi:release factor glutamine methyltransferase